MNATAAKRLLIVRPTPAQIEVARSDEAWRDSSEPSRARVARKYEHRIGFS